MKPTRFHPADPFAVFLQLTATSFSHGLYQPGGSRDDAVEVHALRRSRLIDLASRCGRVLRSLHATEADSRPGFSADKITLARYY